MDDTMKNYNSMLTLMDLIPIILGCMNPDYLNYNSNANNIPDGDPGMFGYIVPGCLIHLLLIIM